MTDGPDFDLTRLGKWSEESEFVVDRSSVLLQLGHRSVVGLGLYAGFFCGAT